MAELLKEIADSAAKAKQQRVRWEGLLTVQDLFDQRMAAILAQQKAVHVAKSFYELRAEWAKHPGLTVLRTSKTGRGTESLNKTFSSVVVMPHAMPRKPAEAWAVHGGDRGVAVPSQMVEQFFDSLPHVDESKGTSLKKDLLRMVRAQPPGTAVIVPGHTDLNHLVLRDSSRVSLQEITQAAQKGVLVILVGCNTARVKVTGEAVIGTVKQIHYRPAIRYINYLLQALPKGPLKDPLYSLQMSGLFVALVGHIIVVFFDEESEIESEEKRTVSLDIPYIPHIRRE